jgi:hypothetical protein
MKHLIISAIAVVAVFTTATTMLSSYSPSERHAAGTIIGNCKNFHSLAGTKASELLPY